MEKRREGQPGTAGFSAKKTAILCEKLPPSGVHSSDEESDLPARLQGVEQKIDLE